MIIVADTCTYIFYLLANAELVAALFPGATVESVYLNDALGKGTYYQVRRRSGLLVTDQDAGWNFNTRSFQRIEDLEADTSPIDIEGYFNEALNSCSDCSDFGTDICGPCKRGY